MHTKVWGNFGEVFNLYGDFGPSCQFLKTCQNYTYVYLRDVHCIYSCPFALKKHQCQKSQFHQI